MASPVATPPPPHSQRYRPSLAGPIVLIAIGALFLLRNFGVHVPVWHIFGRFWPLLLIIWGVIRLIEHMTWEREGYRTRVIGGGGILLLIFIVVLGLSAHYTSDINWQGMRDEIQMDDDFGGIFGNPYTFDDTLSQDVPSHSSLRVVCDRGALSISPSGDAKLRVVIHKKLYAKSQNQANQYNESTRPQITVNDTSIVLNANTNGAGDHAVQSDMEIFVPSTVTLDIASRRGDVTVNTRKADVTINLQHGDLSLNEITGNAALRLEKGSIRATNIEGDVVIDGRIDDVSLENVRGAVRLNGDFFNDIRLSRITRNVTFKSSRSDMDIASVPGELDISRDSLRGNDLRGPARLVTRSKDVHIEAMSGDLQVETSNGDIEVHTAEKLPVGKMNIIDHRGDVSLVLPANAGFQVDATTQKGDIETEFGQLKIDSNHGQSRLSGTVGNGAAKLQVEAQMGDIRISKS